jgi:PIN domain nuclease of toxin-antitoxin system
MNAVLDTHVVVWWFNEPERLSKRARQVLDSQEDRLLVSAATGWELAIKANIDKFEPLSFVLDLHQHLKRANFVELPIDLEHAVRAGLLPLHHNDPFDRLIVAQAQFAKAVIVSADKVLDRYDIKRIW